MKGLIKVAFSSLVVSASITSASHASADVMYNTYNQYASNLGSNGDGDDGYTSSPPYPDRNLGTQVPWVGTSNGALPFGLSTSELLFANWAVQLHAAGDAGQVSSQNAHDLYGVWADIDTTEGAWMDSSNNGTMYAMDLGLIKSDVTQQITLNLNNINPTSWQTFGISVYSGGNQLHPQTVYEHLRDECCDANGNQVPVYGDVSYKYLSSMYHYGYWHHGNQVNNPYKDDPFQSRQMDFLTSGQDSTVTFTAQAGEYYMILLGGNSGGFMYSRDEGYAVNITSSPVPLPGAFWLFSSIFPLLVGVRRSVLQGASG